MHARRQAAERRLTILWSTSTATTLRARSSSFIVRLPVPGPISSTTSVGLMPALSTMDWTTRGFFKMCCPLLFRNSMPGAHSEA